MAPSALSANVRKGADVLSETLAEDSRETRIGLSAAARKAAETFAKMPGSKVIKHAQAHRHMTASASYCIAGTTKAAQRTRSALNVAQCWQPIRKDVRVDSVGRGAGARP